MRQSRSNQILVLAALVTALTIPGALFAQGGGNNNRGILPVVIYTVSSADDGSGSGRQVESALIIYNNGQALLAGGDTAEGLCNVSLDTSDIQTLQRDLRRSGAQRLAGRGNLAGSEDRLVTVTFFINNRNASQSVANTFSYPLSDDGGEDGSGASAPFTRFENVIQSFLTGNFGDC